MSDEIESTLEKQEVLRGMQDRLMTVFEQMPLPEAFKRLVVGLRLCAVCPSVEAAQYNAWLSLSRAWRELELPEGDLEEYQRRVGYKG